MIVFHGPAEVPADFAAAMDDDLSVPAALAVLQNSVGEGNKLLAAGSTSNLAQTLGQVRAMLAILGLDPFTWAGSDESQSGADEALAQLVPMILAERAEAKATKDWARADALRDKLTAAGIELEDTASGARWNLKGGR